MTTTNLAPDKIEAVERLLKIIRGTACVISTCDDVVDFDDMRWIAQDLSFKAHEALQILAGDEVG